MFVCMVLNGGLKRLQFKQATLFIRFAIYRSYNGNSRGWHALDEVQNPKFCGRKLSTQILNRCRQVCLGLNLFWLLQCKRVLRRKHSCNTSATVIGRQNDEFRMDLEEVRIPEMQVRPFNFRWLRRGRLRKFHAKKVRKFCECRCITNRCTVTQ